MSTATLDPLTATALRVGHRELLDTLRELAAGLDPSSVAYDEAALRGALAFLRQEVTPFARWEEGALPPGERWEDVAFDHAFLAMETDALARELEALLAATPGARGRTLSGVCRRLARIEAVLELHVLKEEERPLQCAAEYAASAEPAPAAGSRAMLRGEVSALLAERSWGILATAGPDAPYAVPVSFGWQGRSLYVASGPGRKLELLEGGAAVCLTVVDVQHGELWRSVVARGAAEPVRSVSERLRAMHLLARRRGPGAPRREDLRRLLGARLFRLTPSELTGRTRGRPTP
jgi:uncharacterized protein